MGQRCIIYLGELRYKGLYPKYCIVVQNEGLKAIPI